MNYKQIYDELIARGKTRATSKKNAIEILGYCECHHIIPKCMGGTNDKTNLVFLSAREHFIAHILLIKIYPSNYKLLLACSRMLTDKQGNKLNGKTYDSLKRKISDYRKSQNKYNNEGLAKASEKRKGRTKDNYEPLARASKKLKGRTKETHVGIYEASLKRLGRNKTNYEPMAKVSKKMIGRTKETHEGPRKISEKKKGRTKENDESMKIMSEKLTGRTKETHDYLKTKSERMKGTTKENNEGIRKMAKTKQILSDELQLEMYNNRKNGWSLKQLFKWITEDLEIEIGFSSVSRICNSLKRQEFIN
jgi:hypothetical protein